MDKKVKKLQCATEAMEQIQHFKEHIMRSWIDPDQRDFILSRMDEIEMIVKPYHEKKQKIENAKERKRLELEKRKNSGIK